MTRESAIGQYRAVYVSYYDRLGVVAWTPNIEAIVLRERPIIDPLPEDRAYFSAQRHPGGGYIRTSRREFEARMEELGIHVRHCRSIWDETDHILADYPQWVAWRRALGMTTQWEVEDARPSGPGRQ